MSEFKYFEFRPHGGVYFDKENADIMFQYIDALEAENAKLRELVYKVEHYEQFGCYECPHTSSCDIDTFFDDCIMSHEIEREKRELGIEVDAWVQ